MFPVAYSGRSFSEKQSLFFGLSNGARALRRHFTTARQSVDRHRLQFVLHKLTTRDTVDLEEYLAYQDTAGTTYPTFEVWFKNGELHVGSRSDASTWAFHVWTLPVFTDALKFFQLVIGYNLYNPTPTIDITASGRAIPLNSGSVHPVTGTSVPLMSENSDSGLIIGNNASKTAPFSGCIQSVLGDSSIVGDIPTYESCFGGIDVNSLQYLPKGLARVLGTNGFYLNFSNDQNTTTLGYDTSGANNHFTLEAFSLDNAVWQHSLFDTKAVLDRHRLRPSTGNTPSLSGNQIANYGTMIGAQVSFPIPESPSQYFYAELELQDLQGAEDWNFGLFLTNDGVNLSVDHSLTPGYIGFSVGVFNLQAEIHWNNGSGNNTVVFFPNPPEEGDILKILIIPSQNCIHAGINDSWFTTGFAGTTNQPTPGAEAFKNVQSVGKFLTVCSTSDFGFFRANLNTGQLPFKKALPVIEGFTGTGISAKDIVPTSAGYPQSNFNVVGATGNSSGQSIRGYKFSPGLLWGKRRNSVSGVFSFSKNRGTFKYNYLNSTVPEATNTETLTSFRSDGFGTLSSPVTNGGGITYIYPAWKTADTGVATAASGNLIASQAYSNPDGGLSVVDWSGSGINNAEIETGLGAPPKLAFFRTLDGPGRSYLWAEAIGQTKSIALINASSMVADTPTVFAGTNGSTRFKLGTDSANSLNLSGVSTIATFVRDIPGYSKIGTYDADTQDGVYQYLGFEPRFILFAKIDATGGTARTFVDSLRYEATSAKKYSSDIAGSSDGGPWDIEFTSLGFKVWEKLQARFNLTGGKYLFWAIARTDGAANNAAIQIPYVAGQ